MALSTIFWVVFLILFSILTFGWMDVSTKLIGLFALLAAVTRIIEAVGVQTVYVGKRGEL